MADECESWGEWTRLLLGSAFVSAQVQVAAMIKNSKYGLSRSQPQTLLACYTLMAKSIYRHGIVTGLL